MKEVASPQFHSYAKEVQSNARQLATYLTNQGYSLVSGGTDTHLLLWDLRPTGLAGAKLQTLCDELDITINKNSVPGDISALNPGGVRIGAPAMTSRGCGGSEFTKIGEFLHQAVQLGLKIDAAAAKANEGTPEASKAPTNAHFAKAMAGFASEIDTLKADVNNFASSLYMPGLDNGL